MKKILIAAAAAVTLAGAAGVASAQPYGAPHRPAYGAHYGAHYGGSYGSDAINAKQAQLARRIARGERSGRLDWREARMLRRELARINYQERQFRRTYGLDRREYAILDARLDRLEYRIIAEMRDGRRYGYGYGDRRH